MSNFLTHTPGGTLVKILRRRAKHVLESSSMATVDDRTRFRFTGGQILAGTAGLLSIIATIIGGISYGTRVLAEVQIRQESDRREQAAINADLDRRSTANTNAIRELLSDHGARFDKLTEAINNLAVKVAENGKHPGT